MSTFDKVKDVIIDKLGVEEDSIKSEAHFVNDLGADSLDTVELIMEFEEELGIEIRVIEDFMSLNHAYSHFTITLSAYLCVLKPTKTLQIPTPKASDQIKWVCIQDLENYPFPKANKTLTIALMKQFA